MLKLGNTIIMFIAFMAVTAFAQSVPVPDADPFQAIWDLVANWKTLPPIAIGISVVLILTQLTKKMLPADFKYKEIVALVFSAIYGVLFTYAGGTGWLGAFVLIFFTDNFAKRIYDAWRAVAGKKVAK